VAAAIGLDDGAGTMGKGGVAAGDVAGELLTMNSSEVVVDVMKIVRGLLAGPRRKSTAIITIALVQVNHHFGHDFGHDFLLGRFVIGLSAIRQNFVKLILL
jgi:hypothetical protein